MPNPPVPDLSIIIVSWNVRDLLAACLSSIQKALAAAAHAVAEVIVVDNASVDGSAAVVAAQFPWVQLIANEDNRGFTRGNNQALPLTHGRYVLFLNPDTVVLGDALEAMVAYMDAHPTVGALGPQLRYGDGSLQSSRRRFPTFRFRSELPRSAGIFQRTLQSTSPSLALRREGTFLRRIAPGGR